MGRKNWRKDEDEAYVRASPMIWLFAGDSWRELFSDGAVHKDDTCLVECRTHVGPRGPPIIDSGGLRKYGVPTRDIEDVVQIHPLAGTYRERSGNELARAGFDTHGCCVRLLCARRMTVSTSLTGFVALQTSCVW